MKPTMDTVFRIGSTSQTTKARSALQAHSIPSKMVKTDGNASGGCTWGLRIDRRHYYEAADALTKAGIRYEVL
ncbi:MAG: DUF3343 domain-containing protein [Clostridia bacterium]|nr:DUF3343 domain-containing protein [Clostridia bacterium]